MVHGGSEQIVADEFAIPVDAVSAESRRSAVVLLIPRDSDDSVDSVDSASDSCLNPLERPKDKPLNSWPGHVNSTRQTNQSKGA